MKVVKSIIALGLVVLLTGCGSHSGTAATYSSLVTLDINPSIQLQLDDNDKVVDVIAGNEDAKKVLQDMDLKDSDANVALNAILGSLVRNNYLSKNQNTVLLSVENDDDEKKSQLEDELGQYIHTTLKDYSIESAVFSQNIDIDDDLKALVDKYGISYGKANLIEDILEDAKKNNKNYTADDLVKLNAQDLILMHQSLGKQDSQKMVGQVSTSAYLSRDEALNIALKNASLKQSDVKDLEIDYDMENGVLTYDIEFKNGQNEYEYEVNASKGIVEREVEPKQPAKQTSTNSSSSQKTSSSSSSSSSKNTNYDNTNYDNSNYGSSSQSKSSSGSSSSSSKNTNYDNTNYDDTNYGSSQTKPSGGSSSKPSGGSSTKPSGGSSSKPSSSQDSNYDNSNYNNSNYDDNDQTNYDDNDNTNYDDDD